jgi:hypothetical protein
MESALTTWERFLKDVESATKNIDEPFFRGHADSKWPLVPSLSRYKLHAWFENNLYYDFLTYGASWLPPSTDSWDTLFIMRHHGLPTRLLDWTQSFSTALFFALRNSTTDAAIWILDAYELNKRTIDNEAILHPQTDLDHGYYDYFISDPRKKFRPKALAILPNKTTPRVLAQRGVFTIHKHRDEPLDDVCKRALTKVTLPTAALKRAGTNEFTLFPDLDGLARWLSQAHDVDFAKRRSLRRGKRVRKTRASDGN